MPGRFTTRGSSTSPASAWTPDCRALCRTRTAPPRTHRLPADRPHRTLRYQSQAYRITIDAERTEHTAMMIALANGRQYGNNVCIAPGARLDDGLLEMVIVEPLSVAHIAVRLPSVFLRTLKAGRGVTMRAVRALSVSKPTRPSRSMWTASRDRSGHARRS